MVEDLNIINKSMAFTIRDIFNIFFKKKWIFIGTSLLILIIGLLYTFIKIPQYESVSGLRLLNVYYNDDFIKYFPEEAAAIGIYSTNLKSEELEITILESFIKEIKSSEIINEAAVNIGQGVTNKDISSSLKTLTDNNNRKLLVKVLYRNPVMAQKINQELIHSFIKQRNIRLLSALDIAGRKMDTEIIRLKNEIELGLGTDAIDANKKIYDDISAIKYNIVNNTDFISNSFEIFQEASLPEKAVNSNYAREIPVIFLLSVLGGLIAVFLPSIFFQLKSKNE